MAREDDRVRSRVAEILSSAGLPGLQTGQQVMWMMPSEFLREYEALFWRALKDPDRGRGGQDEKTAEVGKVATKRPSPRVTTDVAEGAMYGTSGGKRYKQFWVIQDEDALAEKTQIDRRLRAMARDMRSKTEKAKAGRCPRNECRKYVDSDWKFCAACGTDLGQTVD